MPGYTGTHSLADLVAATGLGQIDDAAVQASLAAELAAFNGVVQDELRDLVTVTTDVRRQYGAGTQGQMNKADEFARAQTQKGAQTGEVAFPFHKFIYATGWDEDFRRLASPAKYAQVFIGARQAYVKAIQSEIRAALFGSANYTFTDYMATKLDLPVKRLLNADGAAVPVGPNGESFDGSTHTHYLATASLTADDADDLVRTVVEHGNGTDVRVYINQSDEADWKALTGFVPAQPANVIIADNVTRTARPLDRGRLTNRFVGVLANGAEVWTKPWVTADYAFAFDAGSSEKPLAMREDIAGSSRLAQGQLINLTPLSAQHYVARFGVGVNARANGAVLYFGGGTYVDLT
jgi:hypothetical protein